MDRVGEVIRRSCMLFKGPCKHGIAEEEEISLYPFRICGQSKN